MTISDALPVQLWLNGVETFNERIEAGIEPDRCFKQIFNCDDEIRIQYNGLGALKLKATDIDGTELYSGTFTQVAGTTDYWEFAFTPSDHAICDENIFIKIVSPDFSNPTFTGSLAPWTDYGFADSWVYSSGKAEWVASSGSSSSNRLRQSYSFVSGTEYTITIVLTTTGTFTLSLELTDGTHFYYPFGLATPQAITTSGTYIYSFTPPTTYNYSIFSILCVNTQGVSITVDIDSANLTEVEIATSDYVDIRTNHYETQLVQYSNRTNYAGLSYQNSTLFQFRFRTKFFEERFPQENESEGLSDGEIVKLSSTIKSQKLLEIENAPPYIHKKMILILNHNTVYMDSNYWTMEENYEQTKLNDRFPFFLGKVWLTLKNSNFWTNIFGTERVIS